MQRIKRKLSSSLLFVTSFLKWSLFGIIIGVICGVAGSIFVHGVQFVLSFRSSHQYLIWFLPFAGLIIVFLYKLFGVDNDEGANMIISSIRSSKKVPLKMAFLIFASTMITHFFGGSAGRIGAALQIGGSLSSAFGRFIKLNEKDIHIITMCGMSALCSTLFGTPLTAAIFAMEVISVGIMYYTAFVPCLFSAIIACKISALFSIKPITYSIASDINLSSGIILKVIILGGICAIFSMVFCISMHKTASMLKKKIANPYLRIFLGGCVIVILTMLVGNQNYNGVGMDIVDLAMLGQADTFAFLLKILFTVITISVGFKGGEIAPSLFIGATLGCVVAPILGINASLGAALGLIGVFCGVVNCPIASLFFSIELFGSEYIVLFAVICAVSYMLSGYYGLYSSQKIVYSKLQPDFINRSTK